MQATTKTIARNAKAADVVIYSNGNLAIRGTNIGNVSQRKEGTRVIDRSGNVVTMPENRYALSTGTGTGKLAGSQQFKIDVLVTFLRAGLIEAAA